MTITDTATIAPVSKSVTVNASPARAFQVFTDDIDTWWPRSHHIGQSPMTKTVLTPRAGGSVYSEQEDGATAEWGKILKWEPSRAFTLAWQITPEWQYEPLLEKSSEVEVTFTEISPGATRVDLEHRYFERSGPGGESMRTAVDSEGGWSLLLDNFARQVNSGTAAASATIS